jgi:hypothetical protein
MSTPFHIRNLGESIHSPIVISDDDGEIGEGPCHMTGEELQQWLYVNIIHSSRSPSPVYDPNDVPWVQSPGLSGDHIEYNPENVGGVEYPSVFNHFDDSDDSDDEDSEDSEDSEDDSEEDDDGKEDDELRDDELMEWDDRPHVSTE